MFITIDNKGFVRLVQKNYVLISICVAYCYRRLLTILQAESAYCFAASSPWKLAIFGSTTTSASMYFSPPGPAGPCRVNDSVSFKERERRISGSSKDRLFQLRHHAQN